MAIKTYCIYHNWHGTKMARPTLSDQENIPIFVMETVQSFPEVFIICRFGSLSSPSDAIDFQIKIISLEKETFFFRWTNLDETEYLRHFLNLLSFSCPFLNVANFQSTNLRSSKASQPISQTLSKSSIFYAALHHRNQSLIIRQTDILISISIRNKSIC